MNNRYIKSIRFDQEMIEMYEKLKLLHINPCDIIRSSSKEAMSKVLQEYKIESKKKHCPF